MSLQASILALLESSLVRPLVLVVTAWLILRIFRVRHPASRHAVWTAVLIGMLLLPIVSVMAPRLTLPLLPAPAQMSPAGSVSLSTTAIPGDASVTQPPASVTHEAAGGAPASVSSPSVELLIVWFYAAGLLVMLAYRLIGWALLRRVVSRSTVVRLACLRESADVVTPIAVGVLHRVVILPAGWRQWSTHTKRAVLAHEFAHLRRGDTLVAALARLVKCVFWFHPIAWWVSRQTSDLAELACDAIALERVGDPARYSRVLVEFAEAVNRSSQRVALPGLAIASGSRMSERVDQVFEMSGGTMRRLRRPEIWLTAIGLPVMCTAATVALGARAQATQTKADNAPKFDVVSIKPCPGLDVVRPPGSGRGANPRAPQISPGYMHWDCVALAELIDQAYAGKGSQLLNVIARPLEDSPKHVRGGPAWVQSERFTIEARVTGDATPSSGPGRFVQVRDAMMPALRALIEDRFQLKMHRATEERSMYALVAANGGLNRDRMKPSEPGDCWQPAAGTGRGAAPPGFEGKPQCGTAKGTRPRANRRLEYSAYTLSDLAQELSHVMDRVVLDKTGIDGKFNFAIEYAPDDTTPGDRPDPIAAAARAAEMAAAGIPPDPRPDGPSIFKALEALGLKMEPTKGPAEYLVIDSAQRPRPNNPSESPVGPSRSGSRR
jgi:uncharacterized protein (TIGR03435 family)